MTSGCYSNSISERISCGVIVHGSPYLQSGRTGGLGFTAAGTGIFKTCMGQCSPRPGICARPSNPPFRPCFLEIVIISQELSGLSRPLVCTPRTSMYSTTESLRRQKNPGSAEFQKLRRSTGRGRARQGSTGQAAFLQRTGAGLTGLCPLQELLEPCPVMWL